MLIEPFHMDYPALHQDISVILRLQGRVALLLGAAKMLQRPNLVS